MLVVRFLKDILNLLNKVVGYSDQNQMNSSNIAKIFYPSFFPHKQPDTDLSSLRDALPGKHSTLTSMTSMKSAQSMKSSQSMKLSHSSDKNCDTVSSRDTLDTRDVTKLNRRKTRTKRNEDVLTKFRRISNL